MNREIDPKTRADYEKEAEGLRQKIASGNYIKESKWTYDPWYGLIRTERPDTETLAIIERQLNDSSRWVLKSAY